MHVKSNEILSTIHASLMILMEHGGGGMHVRSSG